MNVSAEALEAALRDAYTQGVDRALAEEGYAWNGRGVPPPPTETVDETVARLLAALTEA